MRHPPTAFSHAAGLLLVIAAGLPAQQARNASNTGTPTPATATARADNKRAMTVADYTKWRSIRDVAISDDGVWAAYGYQQRRVDDTLFVKNLNSGAVQTLPRATRGRRGICRATPRPRSPGRSSSRLTSGSRSTELDHFA